MRLSPVPLWAIRPNRVLTVRAERKRRGIDAGRIRPVRCGAGSHGSLPRRRSVDGGRLATASSQRAVRRRQLRPELQESESLRADQN
jgi:hypothetical protein